MKDTYRKVKVEEYVKELLERGIKPVQAKKFALIHAREGKIGETVITWSQDSKGNPIIEKTAQVKIDEKTGKPGHVVTKLNEDGTPIIDKNGHTNTWIIEDGKFQERYEQYSEMGESVYKPKGTEQIFIQIQDDIVIEQWGKEEKISKGGYINITDISDMYGISERDFNDTYKIIQAEQEKELKKHK